MRTQRLLNIVIAAIEELKAHDIITIDVHKLTTITDTMVICTGRSTRQVKSIADNVVMRAKEHAIWPLSMQGENVGEWVLVDLGEIVVHIMLPDVRAFYDLEKLWRTPA